MTKIPDDANRCACPGCSQVLTGVTVITTHDGRRYCKRHGDRLPAYLRKPQRSKKVKANSVTTLEEALHLYTDAEISPEPEPDPPVPLCACGVWMYAADSQAAGRCFVCRKYDRDDQDNKE